ncbi:MAG: NAD(P)-dependent oxidoreductase [Cellulomonas sp.]|nr:NAD(P)-dependent oxidoreductase [Cellulomonas sp.]
MSDGRRATALTGSTGFIGSAVAEALAQRGVEAVALVRGATDPGPLLQRRVVGDLTAAATLPGLVEGAEVLVHAASYVGSDPLRQEEVNVAGTRDLLRAAREAGVRRIVYVSTAGVYGGSLRGGEREAEAVVAPGSTLSASRRRAEELVLAAGGLVIRPHLVYGVGDRWFLGALVPLMHTLGARIGDGRTRISVIDRLTLGRLVAALALGDAPVGVYHGALVDPVPVGALVEQVHRAMGVAVPQAVLDPAEAARRLAPFGVRASQLALVTQDSWFDASAAWAVTGLVPPPAPVVDAPTAAWYRSRLTAG